MISSMKKWPFFPEGVMSSCQAMAGNLTLAFTHPQGRLPIVGTSSRPPPSSLLPTYDCWHSILYYIFHHILSISRTHGCDGKLLYFMKGSMSGLHDTENRMKSWNWCYRLKYCSCPPHSCFYLFYAICATWSRIVPVKYLQNIPT